MKSLPEFPTELDLYLNSLLDLLRTRYYNVSLNRGSEQYDFFMCRNLKNKRHIKRITISTTELLTYFEYKQTPPQILNLIK